MPVDTGDRHLQAVVIERTPYTLSKLQELFHMQIVEWDGITYRALTDEEGIVVSVCGGRTPEPSRPMLVNNIHDKEDEQRGIFVPFSNNCVSTWSTDKDRKAGQLPEGSFNNSRKMRSEHPSKYNRLTLWSRSIIMGTRINPTDPVIESRSSCGKKSNNKASLHATLAKINGAKVNKTGEISGSEYFKDVRIVVEFNARMDIAFREGKSINYS
ncbi:hypothetical protein B0H14DRAFT_2579635 [Mycena olivaceomarginata]|nr:hypothetical protein B0H14DRAFT_2579635 [Mycena olivaceomarginata]